MEIHPFESLKITTITLVITLSNRVNADIAFQVLPITRVVVQQTRESSKCKIPHCKTPGSILSMRYRDNIRGLIRNKSNPFKNAVTIDISTVQKNINLKLSSYSIQMCGASSNSDGVEAATHIINHLKNIQSILNLVQNNTVQTLEAIEWIKDITRGNVVERIYSEEKRFINVTLLINHTTDNEISRPMIPIPITLNQNITIFLLSLCDDFIYHSDMCRKLDFMLKIPGVIDPLLDTENPLLVLDYPLELKNIDEAMVNYNFSLGFEVDRAKLNQYIDGINGFISRYNNALATSVTIELPYTPSITSSIKRRKNKVPHVSFLCYRSGSITMSGPGGTIMYDSYYLFMNTISELQTYIEYNPLNI